MRQLIILCGLLVLFAIVNTYDFDDPDYNQILADDLENWYTSSLSSYSRVRRDTEDDDKCRKRKHKVCCGETVLDNIRKSDKDAKDACFKEITGKDKSEKPEKHHHMRPFDPFDCEKVQQRRNDMVCIHQCTGQKLKYIDESGKIMEDAFSTYVKEKLAEAKYLDPVADKIIEGCLEEIKNATESTQSTASKQTCKPDGITSNFCIFKQIQLNCPEDQITDKEFCSKMQERLREGKDFGPGPDH